GLGVRSMASQRALPRIGAFVEARPARGAEAIVRPGPPLTLGDRRLIRRAGDLASVASPWLAAAITGADPHWPTLVLAVVSWLLAASFVETHRPRRGARLLATGLLTLLVAAAVYGAAALALPSLAPRVL